MQGLFLAQLAHIVNVLPPVDITGGVAGDRFKMSNHGHATIIVQVGVSAAPFTKIILREADAAEAGNTNDIPFTLYAEETSAGDTLGPKEAIAAAGRDPSANDNIFYVIELDGRELSDGFPWVELALTNGTNSAIVSAVAILSGSRYAADQSDTAIA